MANFFKETRVVWLLGWADGVRREERARKEEGGEAGRDKYEVLWRPRNTQHQLCKMQLRAHKTDDWIVHISHENKEVTNSTKKSNFSGMALGVREESRAVNGTWEVKPASVDNLYKCLIGEKNRHRRITKLWCNLIIHSTVYIWMLMGGVW